MKLRLARRAAQDLLEISNYLSVRNPEAARRVRDVIFDALQNLTIFPKPGRMQNIEGVRKLVTRKYSYLVYYTIDESADEVSIVAIQHPARERDFSDV
jgi:toxin ParE1/3/4